MANFCGEESDGDEVEDIFSSQTVPLLPMPAADATPEEWASFFPISQLPDLPQRDARYWQEPFIGILVVGVMITFLVGATYGLCWPDFLQKPGATILVVLISTWALLAIGGTSFLFFGRANEIQRTLQTCYPIPEDVAKRLIDGKSMKGLSNIKREQGVSYCIRCYLWRPSKKEVGKIHHCRVCQRCVTKFDHHCGVFGRCIVGGNLVCFYGIISMAFAGGLTAFAALALQVGTITEENGYSKTVLT